MHKCGEIILLFMHHLSWPDFQTWCKIFRLQIFIKHLTMMLQFRYLPTYLPILDNIIHTTSYYQQHQRHLTFKSVYSVVSFYAREATFQLFLRNKSAKLCKTSLFFLHHFTHFAKIAMTRKHVFLFNWNLEKTYWCKGQYLFLNFFIFISFKANICTNFSANSINIHGVIRCFMRKMKWSFCHTYMANCLQKQDKPLTETRWYQHIARFDIRGVSFGG